MKYSMKWVEENMGITTDMVKYYERTKILSDKLRDERGYRIYSEEDLRKIWAIRLLIRIGFTASDIKNIIKGAAFDFYTELGNKIAKLEKEISEETDVLNFAKTIRLTGKIPTPQQMGNINFEDFIVLAQEEWNFCDKKPKALLAKFAEKNHVTKEWELDDMEELLDIVRQLEKRALLSIVHSDCRTILKMQDFGYDSSPVQRVTELLCNDIITCNSEGKLKSKANLQVAAKHLMSFFAEGDVSKLLEQSYGREGCLFIAKALEHYGNSDIIETKGGRDE